MTIILPIVDDDDDDDDDINDDDGINMIVMAMVKMTLSRQGG